MNQRMKVYRLAAAVAGALAHVVAVGGWKQRGAVGVAAAVESNEMAPSAAAVVAYRPIDGRRLFRSVVVGGLDGGQEVYHLHLHVYGGPKPWRAMSI